MQMRRVSTESQASLTSRRLISKAAATNAIVVTALIAPVNSGTVEPETATGTVTEAEPPATPDVETGEATIFNTALKSWAGVVFGSKVNVSVKSFLVFGFSEKLLSENEALK